LTHIDDIKWSSSGFLCELAENIILILAWLWLKSAKLWPATVPSEHGKSKISMA
jgi:hypothetical protein